MQLLRTARRAAVALALLAACHASTANAADKIQLKSGTRQVADQVTVDHWDEVRWKRGAAESVIKPGAQKVRSIEYGDAPEAFTLAIEKRDALEFENAVQLFRAAAVESGVRPWIKVAGPFEAAETLRLWGARDRAKFDDAVKAYDAALAADEKTRLRPDVIFGRALARLGAGDLDAGLADLDLLEKEAKANLYGVDWEMRAAYEKAQALDEAGRVDDARREFSRLQTNARSFAGMADVDESVRKLAHEMAGAARLAEGRTLVRDGKAAEAERFFDKIVRDEQEPLPVRAAALVGQGEALMKQDRLKEAQLAFARVRVQFAAAEEAAAEATYRLGLVAKALGAAEPRGSKLAQDYFLETATRYAESRWARKAQEELN